MSFTELEIVQMIALAIISYLYFRQREELNTAKGAMGFLLHKLSKGEAEVVKDSEGFVHIQPVTKEKV